MDRLSNLLEHTKWIIASPASDSENYESEILVCREAVRRKNNILHTYVLINYKSEKNIIDERGRNQCYLSAIYRKDLNEDTELSRISAIAFFPKPFAKGKKCLHYFYANEPWQAERRGFSSELVQFMINHAPLKIT